MIEACVAYCKEQGYQFLTVKTLDESAEYEPYNGTRAFYKKEGLFIFNTFVSLRQSIVLVIFFNAIAYLIDKKRLKYVVTILLCSFMHSSALILLPLVFIDKINLTKNLIF